MRLFPLSPGTPEALRAHRNKKRQKKKTDRHARTKVAFLRYSYYDIAFKYFVEQVLDADYVSLPEPTRLHCWSGAPNTVTISYVLRSSISWVTTSKR